MSRLMYDSDRPSAIPSNAGMVAGYIDGSRGQWADTDWDRFPHAVRVRIARRATTNDGHVLDVEEGIVWPPEQAIDWVLMRREAGVDPSVYCNQLYGWPLVRRVFQQARIPEPHYWVARYNNDDTIPLGAVAKQYANEPITGGHYDVSVVADFWPGVDGETMTDINPIQPISITYPGNRNDGLTVPLNKLLGDTWVNLTDMAKDDRDVTLSIPQLRQRLVRIEDLLTVLIARLDVLVGDGVRLGATGSITIAPQ